MNIYLLDINNITKKDIALVKRVFPKRYERACGYVNKEDYLRSLGSSFLIKRAYKNITEGDIEYGEFSKPKIADKVTGIGGKRFFNISHSGKYVCLVKGFCDIGIDIEQINERPLKAIEKVFFDDELSFIDGDRVNFFKLWCQKESAMKMLGFGIGLSPKSFNVLNFNRGKSIALSSARLYNVTTEYEGYVISVCYGKKIGKTKIIKVN